MRLKMRLSLAVSGLAVVLASLLPAPSPASAGPVAGHAQQLAEIPGVAVLGSTVDAAGNLYLMTFNEQSFQIDKMTFGIYEVSQGGTVAKLRDVQTEPLTIPTPIGAWNGYLYFSGIALNGGSVTKVTYAVWSVDLTSTSSAPQSYFGPDLAGMPEVKLSADPGYKMDALTGTVYGLPKRKSGSRALVSVAATGSPTVPGAVTDLGNVSARELAGVVGGRVYTQVNDGAARVSRLEYRTLGTSSFSDLGLKVPFDAKDGSPRMALASCSASGECLYSSYRPRTPSRPHRIEVVWLRGGQRTTVLTGTRKDMLSSAVGADGSGPLYAIRSGRIDFTETGLVINGATRIYAVS